MEIPKTLSPTDILKDLALSTEVELDQEENDVEETAQADATLQSDDEAYYNRDDDLRNYENKQDALNSQVNQDNNSWTLRHMSFKA